MTERAWDDYTVNDSAKRLPRSEKEIPMPTVKPPLSDSGARMTYSENGALREPVGDRPRPALITPFGLQRLAQHYANGAKKYADRNWEKGMPYSRYTDSMFRHLIAWMMGDKKEDHLAAIAWNAFSIMHHQEMKESHLDDMPNYIGE